MEHHQNGNYNMNMKEYDMKEYNMKELEMEQMQPGQPMEPMQPGQPMPYCPQPMPHGPKPMPYGPRPMPYGHGPMQHCCMPPCRPIVCRRHRVVNKYYCRVQPVICHDHTHICNHVITKKQYIPKHTCSESTVCRTEDKGCC